MKEAVLAFLEFKIQNTQRLPFIKEQAGTWRNPKEIQATIPNYSAACIDATIKYCTYIFETYVRFPAYHGPLRTTLANQAHHLDLDFYDRHYQPGAYTETQATHFKRWR